MKKFIVGCVLSLMAFCANAQLGSQTGSYGSVGVTAAQIASSGGVTNVFATAISTTSFAVSNCPTAAYNQIYSLCVGSLVLNGYADYTNAANSRHLCFNDPSEGVANAWFLETSTNANSADFYTPNNPGPDLYPFQPFNSVSSLSSVGWLVYPVRTASAFAPAYFPNLQSNAIYVDAQVGSDVYGQAGVYPFKSISVAIGSTNAPYPVYVSVGNFTEQNIYLRPMQAIIGNNSTPAAFNVGTGTALSHFYPPVGGSTVLFYNTAGGGSMWVTATNLVQNVFFADGAGVQPLFSAGTNLTMSGVTTMPWYSVNDFFQGNSWYNTTLINCQIQNAGTINAGEGENSGMTALFYQNLLEPWAFGIETYASGYVSYTGNFSNSLNLIVGGLVWLTNRSSSGACLQAGTTNVGWELHGPIFRYSGNGAVAITNLAGAATPINGWYDDNGNVTEIGTNHFNGSGTGLTNLTSLVFTNSSTGFLTSGAFKTMTTAGFLSATFASAATQTVWLTNQTTHFCALGGYTNTCVLFVNSGDSVAFTNGAGSGGSSLVNSIFQAYH